MRRALDAVMGLDLSARASAVQVVPLNWGGDWTRVRTLVAGSRLDKAADEHDRVQRIDTIAEEILDFALAYGVGIAWFESYAFGIRFGAHTAGEVGGAVRAKLWRAGIVLRVANMGTARKLILGDVPRGTGKAKAAVFRALKAAGMPIRKDDPAKLDKADAFVAANLGLSEAGAYCFAQRSLK